MPRLDYDTPFSATDIMSITMLASSVYLVTGLGDSSVVIKAEKKGNKQKEHMMNTFQVMRVVSPTARIKMLEKSEIQALTQWLNQIRDYALHDDRETQKLISDLGSDLVHTQRVLLKMETMKLATFENNNDKASKKIGKALNAPNGLEDMGMIIAADMFSGNNDRFDFETVLTPGRGITWNGKQLNYLFNVGNIMINETGEGAKLVGMDPFHNSTEFADLKLPVNDSWPYKIFHPSTRASLVPYVADLCAWDLKKVVGKTTGFISRHRLTKDAADRLAVGMNKGADLIESHFKQKYNRPNVVRPAGLASRADKAGWTWFTQGSSPQQLLSTLTGNSRRQYN
ncbi:hypothetical protein F183_A17910 [Bryobacterales bacterium F-183]|nr:hypothetical protein F183_A17910 [Bryobacterales bacterium F-183]